MPTEAQSGNSSEGASGQADEAVGQLKAAADFRSPKRRNDNLLHIGWLCHPHATTPAQERTTYVLYGLTQRKDRTEPRYTAPQARFAIAPLRALGPSQTGNPKKKTPPVDANLHPSASDGNTQFAGYRIHVGSVGSQQLAHSGRQAWQSIAASEQLETP